ncbi:fused response regulator/phosphatase [Spirochaeta cellobiosiphila]|uniref:fused response regulator/phosphatase n=1 Tax=Spirochaeta cellobiosiphila TaxID=504483 RepID=UPI00042220C1|nr:fused response regulator/phosphatase [Spirochaeta cellobiosiphila]
MSKTEIILVDDEAPVLRALKRELATFTKSQDMEINTFDSPEEALNYIRENGLNVSILISDQKMPGLKGNELIGKVKELNPNIVPILITAYTDMEDIVKSIRTGIFSFILKPWDEEDLIRQVEKAWEIHQLRTNNKKYLAMLDEELKWAGLLQDKFLTLNIPHSNKLSFSVNYKPQLACGGDFYDVIRINDDNYLTIIADVAGHGVKAAFITFILKTILHDSTFSNLVNDSITPSHLLSWLNKRICKELESIDSLIVTLCICRVDLQNNKLWTANGGHVPPAIIRDKDIKFVEAFGTALGFSKDIEYTNYCEDIKQGDRILLYTDGISEIDNYGYSLRDIILNHEQRKDFDEAIMNEIQKNMEHNEFRDDMTLMTIEVL